METDPLVDEALAGLEDRLGRGGVDLSIFRGPASGDEILTLLDPYPHMRMNPSLMSFYRWHDGCDDQKYPQWGSVFPIWSQVSTYWFPGLSGSFESFQTQDMESLLDYWEVDLSKSGLPENAAPVWPLFSGEFAPVVIVQADCYEEGAVYEGNFGAGFGVDEGRRAESLLEVVNHWNACIDDGRYAFETQQGVRWCIPTTEWNEESDRIQAQPGNRQRWLV